MSTSFKLRTAEFNTSKLNDLAGALAQAFSANGSTGINVNSMNITTLNSTNINATNFTATNFNPTNFTTSNLIVTTQSILGGITAINNNLFLGGNLRYSNIVIKNNSYIASGNNLAILFTGSGPYTLTLSPVASFPGLTYKIFNDTNSNLNISLNGSDKYLGTGSSVPSLPAFSAISLTNDNIASWWNI